MSWTENIGARDESDVRKRRKKYSFDDLSTSQVKSRLRITSPLNDNI